MTTYAVNENGATTRYTGYDFESFCHFNGKYYGIKADGLYLLDGTADAFVDLGDLDFGTSLEKRVTNAYVGGASDAQLELTITQRGTEYTYPARSYDSETNVQRFDTGKGLRANYFGVKVSNVEQSPFTIDAVEVAAVATSRRI